jgi:hypothetical protein
MKLITCDGWTGSCRRPTVELISVPHGLRLRDGMNAAEFVRPFVCLYRMRQKPLCTYRRRCVCSESSCTLMHLHFSYLSYNKWKKWPPHACRHASTCSVCKYTQRFNRRNIPDEICDGFLQFEESLRIVFANCAFYCHPPHTIIKGCKAGWPW